MTRFRYQAVDPSGVLHRGSIDAQTESEARAKLRGQSLLPVVIGSVSTPAPEAATQTFPGFKAKVSAATLSRISRQLASLVANGIRVEDALAAIARQGLPKASAASLLAVRKLVVEGRSLSGALALQDGIYPKPFIAAIAAAETSGQLAIVLEHLARQTENEWTNRRAIQFALIYPAFLTLVSIVIISLLLTNVVPGIVAVYQRRGTDLPLATDVLIWLSGAASDWGLPAIVVLAAAVFGLHRGLKVPARKLAAAKLSLRLPIAGRFIARGHAARMAATLAMLVQSGVPLVRALRLSAEVSGNVHVRAAMLKAAGEVSDGAALDAALSRTGFVSPLMLSMISGAMRSGQLGEALEWVARDEQSALDQTMKAMAALLEPAILLIMGGVILFIVLAILTPITGLNSLEGIGS